LISWTENDCEDDADPTLDGFIAHDAHEMQDDDDAFSHLRLNALLDQRDDEKFFRTARMGGPHRFDQSEYALICPNLLSLMF
jgi:hypothetical protein